MCHRRRALRTHLRRRKRSLRDQAIEVSGRLGQLGPALTALSTIGCRRQRGFQLCHLPLKVADLALADQTVRPPGVFAPVAREPPMLIDDILGIVDDRCQAVDLCPEPLGLLLQFLDLVRATLRIHRGVLRPIAKAGQLGDLEVETGPHLDQPKSGRGTLLVIARFVAVPASFVLGALLLLLATAGFLPGDRVPDVSTRCNMSQESIRHSA